MADNAVLRTMGYWQQFFAKDKKQAMLLKMMMYEKKLDDATKMSHDDVANAMAQISGRCLHDTDLCLGNTRRDI